MRYAAFAVMTLLLTRCQPEQPKPQTVNLVYDSTYQRLIPHVKRGDKIAFNQLPQGASIAWNSDTSPCMMLDDHTCQIRNDASKIYTFKCAPDTNVRCDPQVAVDEDRQENKPNLAVLPPLKDGSRVPVNVVVVNQLQKRHDRCRPNRSRELKCTESGSCLERSTPGCKRLVGRLRATTR